MDNNQKKCKAKDDIKAKFQSTKLGKNCWFVRRQTPILDYSLPKIFSEFWDSKMEKLYNGFRANQGLKYLTV